MTPEENRGGKFRNVDWDQKEESTTANSSPIINFCMQILTCCSAVIRYEHMHSTCRKSNRIYLCVQTLLMDSVVQQGLYKNSETYWNVSMFKYMYIIRREKEKKRGENKQKSGEKTKTIKHVTDMHRHLSNNLIFFNQTQIHSQLHMQPPPPPQPPLAKTWIYDPNTSSTLYNHTLEMSWEFRQSDAYHTIAVHPVPAKNITFNVSEDNTVLPASVFWAVF